MGRTPAWEAEYAEYFAGRQRSFMRTAYAMLGLRVLTDDQMEALAQAPGLDFPDPVEPPPAP